MSHSAGALLRPSFFYTGGAITPYIQQTLDDFRQLGDKFELPTLDGTSVQQLVPNGDARSDLYEVAFLFIDESFKSNIADYAPHLPRSITFVIRQTTECWSHRPLSQALATYRFLDRQSDGTWKCGDRPFSDLKTAVYSNIAAMWAGWKWTDELETNMQVISTHAKMKHRTCDSMVKKLIYPFDTRSEGTCRNIYIIDANIGVDNNVEDYVKQHPLHDGSGKVAFHVAGNFDWSGGISRSSLLIIVHVFANLPDLKRALAVHEKYARDHNVSVFTIISVKHNSVGDFGNAFKVVSATTNCVIVSNNEFNDVDWLSHITTAIGATKIDQFRQQYSAVTDSQYKQAIQRTSAIMKNAEVTSKCVINALSNV